jgi:hypothetical protein
VYSRPTAMTISRDVFPAQFTSRQLCAVRSPCISELFACILLLCQKNCIFIFYWSALWSSWSNPSGTTGSPLSRTTAFALCIWHLAEQLDSLLCLPLSGSILRISTAHLECIDCYENIPRKYRREQIVIAGESHWVCLKNI